MSTDSNSFLNLKTFIFLIFILFIFSITPAYSHEYIIIQGSNINFRTSPSTNSKVIGTFKENELTFFVQKSEKESKIGDDNYYWYKVKRLNRKTGWVYGKYCYYLDENKIPEKYYKQILNDILITPAITDGIGVEFYNVNFEFNKNENIIMVKYINVGPPAIFANKRYYDCSDSNIKQFFETSYNSEVIIKDKYIFDIGKEYIFIHKKNEKDNNKLVASDNIRRDNYKKNFYDSYLEFNEKTMILTKYYRDAPGVPMRIEKYHFNEQKDKLENVE